MVKYIDIEAAKEAARRAECDANYDGRRFDAECVENAIDFTPAADVVEVVRCKDCRYYYKDADGYEMCDNSEGRDHISADGFCAWAKRRADNG